MKRQAFIVDIDGTVALKGDRHPYDMTTVSQDAPNEPVLQVARALWLMGANLIYLSGRFEAARADTIEWLLKHGSPQWSALYMRPDGDFRKDSELKKEFYYNHIEPTYDVLCVLDDRDQVVRMWREELKLCCLQVAYGDF